MNWTVFWIAIALGFVFIIGSSRCKVTGFELNTYSSKDDCTYKILNKMDEDEDIISLEMINNVERYCEQYDR